MQHCGIYGLGTIELTAYSRCISRITAGEYFRLVSCKFAMGLLTSAWDTHIQQPVLPSLLSRSASTADGASVDTERQPGCPSPSSLTYPSASWLLHVRCIPDISRAAHSVWPAPARPPHACLSSGRVVSGIPPPGGVFTGGAAGSLPPPLPLGPGLFTRSDTRHAGEPVRGQAAPGAGLPETRRKVARIRRPGEVCVRNGWCWFLPLKARKVYFCVSVTCVTAIHSKL